MSESPRIRSVATAVPPYVLPQADLRGFAERFFADDFPSLPRLLRVFDNAAIERRQFVRPQSWYEQPRGFPEKNAVYIEGALALGEQAAAEAIERAGVSPRELGAIVFVSSTGIATPSLESVLVQRLGLSRSIARVPLWGLGCAGGAAGIARAATLARGLRSAVLLVAVEACSVTFVHEDRSRSNLVATALFGDGAAAAVIGGGGSGPAVLGGFSHLVDDSADVMGWTLRETGLQVRFARSIPGIVRQHVPHVVEAALAKYGVERATVRDWVLHPGGAKVLAAYEDALELKGDELQHARVVLREHGNMSSPTVMFVLERWLRSTPASESPAVLMSLGPGFCAEGVVMRW